MNIDSPGEHLLMRVRAGFISQGISLSKWCSSNNVCRVWAADALRGKRNGPAALSLRLRLLESAAVKSKSN